MPALICSKCDKVFSKPYGLARHEQTCDVNVKHKFPGRIYQTTQIIFEQLEFASFYFDDADKLSPYFGTWDLESFQRDTHNDSEARLQWLAEHVPASISVASNVPGFEKAQCFITDDEGPQNS